MVLLLAWIAKPGEFPEQDTWGSLPKVFTQPYPLIVFTTDEDKYPYYKSQKMISVAQKPYPFGVLVTGTEMWGGYPTFVDYNIISVPQEIYPDWVFVTKNDYPKYWGHHIVTMGAFNRSTLETAKIPISVKTLGSHSFADTLIADVTISSDCTYKDTTFPKDCTITKV